MPNCFQLIKKSDLEAGPVRLSQIDREMCEHFGVERHPTKYHHEWYNTIGFRLAVGQTFEKQLEDAYAEIARIQESTSEERGREELQAEWLHHIEVIKWLDANFVSDVWATIGR